MRSYKKQWDGISQKLDRKKQASTPYLSHKDGTEGIRKKKRQVRGILSGIWCPQPAQPRPVVYLRKEDATFTYLASLCLPVIKSR